MIGSIQRAIDIWTAAQTPQSDRDYKTPWEKVRDYVYRRHVDWVSGGKGVMVTGPYAEFRTLGFGPFTARALAVAPGGWKNSPAPEWFGLYCLLNDTWAWPPRSQPWPFTSEISKLTQDPLYGATHIVNEHQFKLTHPCPDGRVLTETEWQPGDVWHWLWCLVNSRGLPEQGKEVARRLFADPLCVKDAKEAGLLSAIAHNLVFALTGYELTEIHRYETGRFVATAINAALALPSWWLGDIFNQLLFEPDRAHPVIMETLRAIWDVAFPGCPFGESRE